MAAIIAGGAVAETEWGAALFTLDRTTIAWGIIIYGFIAAVLPVWLLLAPRDYLSTFMKIGTIVMLAVGDRRRAAGDHGAGVSASSPAARRRARWCPGRCSRSCSSPSPAARSPGSTRSSRRAPPRS